MKLSQKQQVFSRNIASLIQFATSKGYGLTFGHAWRSQEEQERLLKEGKTKTMASNHLLRLAVDFNVFIDGKLCYEWDKLQPLGNYWESLHPQNRWGGDWNKNGIRDGFIDAPHFEMMP